MANRAPEIVRKTPYEERLFDFVFKRLEKTGEAIQGSPTVAFSPSTSPDLAIAGIVTSGARVQAKYSGGKDGQEYKVNCKIITPTEKLEIEGVLIVREPAVS